MTIIRLIISILIAIQFITAAPTSSPTPGTLATTTDSKSNGRGKGQVKTDHLTGTNAVGLLQESNLHYRGGCKLPQGNIPGYTVKFANQLSAPIAYRATDKILTTTTGWAACNGTCSPGANSIAEVTLCDYTTDTDGNPSTLSTPYAKVRSISGVSQDPIEPTEGTVCGAGSGFNCATDEISGGGILIDPTDSNYFFFTQYVVYDGEGHATKEIWRRRTDLSIAGVTGPYHIEANSLKAGHVSGSLTFVPTSRQSSLGGKVCSSQTGISIISRTSYGPDLICWDPANFAATTPATRVLWYFDPSPIGCNGTANCNFFVSPQNNRYGFDTPPNVVNWPWQEGNETFWNGSHMMRSGGSIIADNFRTLLSFGGIGRGFYAYGIDDPVNNPPFPPLTSQGELTSSGAPGVPKASTNGTGLIVTLPNTDLTTVKTDGTQVIWLIGQSSPTVNSWPGRAYITAKADSGLSTANVTVASAFGTNLSGIDWTIGLEGSGATTSSDGLTVTVPSFTLTSLDTSGGKIICLKTQTTPTQNGTSNNAVRNGCSYVVGKANSGASNASITVSSAFPINLTNQAFAVGEPNVYDPNRSGQGNHAWPYITMAYAYDLADLEAVKAGNKNAWDVAPYGMWDLTNTFPSWATGCNYAGQICGAAWDSAGHRLFISIVGAEPSTDYKTILVFDVS